MPAADSCARALLAWHDAHGRRDLPWQRPRSPYRVWVSEIMLQQTRVATVIGYFNRFIARFPDVHALAGASLDEVLEHWAGLGYYARARNLHRAAQQVRDEHGGELPADIDALQALPGIGRSTAGAILALAHGERHPILDGNVKRVLARYHGIEGWPGQAAVAQALWAHAEAHTPAERVADYTQAIMDLGATLCTRRKPGCAYCPLAEGCVARAEGRPEALPASKPQRETPLRQSTFVILRDQAGRLLLERRPPAGVWGGLWSFPEIAGAAGDAGAAEAERWCRTQLGVAAGRSERLPPMRHVFTHFRLDITPVLLDVPAAAATATAVAEAGAGRRWHAPAESRGLGTPAPVRRLIDAVIGSENPDES